MLSRGSGKDRNAERSSLCVTPTPEQCMTPRKEADPQACLNCSRNMTKRRRTPPPCGDRRRRWPQKLQRCGPTSSDAGMKELEQILEREEMGLVLSDPAALEMKLSSLYELLQFHNLPQSILLHLWKPLGLCFNHSD
ncbi:bis(5'-adenosyl)-triphosphatase isoform X2 [Camelus bactrianus]|uniref:Bis(5'-adenosyl)-triphosphatase isoform X2 n=1 Tax=Camelus bactrianus TaxID=9837 RepID=A0AC58NSD4_CAMBA